MADEREGKKPGAIFMGDREVSVEQLNAMQERVNREKLQKEQSEDYMERVKARAVERAREILGAAYAERQKVLEEAKGEAAMQKRLAAQECGKIKASGEEIRQKAQEELKAAEAEKEKAIAIREAAYSDGYSEGMNKASVELSELRAKMGQSVASLLRALERERKSILANWRDDLVELVKVATQAGTGFALKKEHDAILKQLVFQALDLLENRTSISVRVNPEDEETVGDMFRAARERAPELKQWTVTGDDSIESGGLVAESGTGSVDLRRGNFREMVDSVLFHLGLPELPRESEESQEIARLVEQEVANIASLTPELYVEAPTEEPEPPTEENEADGEAASGESAGEQEAAAPEEGAPEEAEPQAAPLEPISEELSAAEAEITEDLPVPMDEEETDGGDPSLQELEDELFPLDGEAAPQDQPKGAPEIDPKTLSEGGFL